MRHQFLFLASLVIIFCAFFGCSEDVGMSKSNDVLTLVTFTTITPAPVIITSSAVSSAFLFTAADIIIYTSYPPNGASPFEVTSTAFATFTLAHSTPITVATVTTETQSSPIPEDPSTTQATTTLQTTTTSSIMSTENVGTGLVTSHVSSTAASESGLSTASSSTGRPAMTASSTTTASATIPASTPIPTQSSNSNSKQGLNVAVIVPAIVGAIVAIAGMGLLVWCLRRRNAKNNRKSDSVLELSDGIFDGRCRNTGYSVSCVGPHSPHDRISFMDALGLTDKKLWPRWPFGDRVMGTGPIKHAIIGASVPASSRPTRPLRPSTDELQPFELHGDSMSGTNHIAPPIPPKSPDRDLTLYGGKHPKVSSPITAQVEGLATVPGITTRDRSLNALVPTIPEAENLRIIALRENTLAKLEGRQLVYHEANQRQSYNQSVGRMMIRSRDRTRELAARFPFVTAPAPGTINNVNDAPYSEAVDGGPLQRMDDSNGFGRWI